MRNKSDFENYVYAKSEKKRKIISLQIYAKTVAVTAAVFLLVFSAGKLMLANQVPNITDKTSNDLSDTNATTSNVNQIENGSLEKGIESDDDYNNNNALDNAAPPIMKDNDNNEFMDKVYSSDNEKSALRNNYDNAEDTTLESSLITFSDALSANTTNYQLPNCLLVTTPNGETSSVDKKQTISEFCSETLALPYETSEKIELTNARYKLVSEITFTLSYNQSDCVSIEIKNGDVYISYSEISVDNTGTQIIGDVTQKRTATDAYINLLYDICNSQALFDDLG